MTLLSRLKGAAVGAYLDGDRVRHAVAAARRRLAGTRPTLHFHHDVGDPWSHLALQVAVRLAELYPQGGDVTISDLVAKGAVRKNEKVKVLGTGEIAVKLNVAVDKVSSSAEQKIVAAGGSVK